MTIDLVRGDRATLDIADLLDGDDASAVFGVDDVVRWTAKRLPADPDEHALLAKSSTDEPGGIALSGDGGTITIEGTDWDGIKVRSDLPYFWDLQLAVGGDEDQIVTLASGAGTITPDISLTAP